MLYYFCCPCHFCNQNHCLFQNQHYCHFRCSPRQSHLDNYFNIGPYNICILQSNSLDYKMNPCWVQVIAIFRKHPLHGFLFIPCDSFFPNKLRVTCCLSFIKSTHTLQIKLICSTNKMTNIGINVQKKPTK